MNKAVYESSLLFLCLTLIASAECKSLLTCGKGHFVYYHSGVYGCKECPQGTFMSYENHSYAMCKTCQKADPYGHEIEAAPCTSTADTVIKCNSEYYRKEMKDRIMHNGGCYRCSLCEYNNNAPFEIKKCGSFHNTVCCPHDSDVAVEDDNGIFRCSRKDITMEGPQYQHLPPASKEGESNFLVCDPGEYMTFNKQRSQQMPSCNQCPRGTFMDKEKHMETHCKDCSADEGKVLVRKCTQTSDAVFVNVQNEKNGSRAEISSKKGVIFVIAILILFKILQ